MSRWRRTPRLAWAFAALALVASAGWPTTAQADEWQVVAPGVTFREFILPGPNHAFVARLDTASPDVTIESSIASGALASGVETVSEMARRYDGTLSAWGGFWGPRQRVVVAVNGSSYHPETGEPYGGLIYDGWYALRFGEAAGTSGLAWTADRRAVIGGCISNPVETNVVTNVRTGVQVPLRSVNRDLHGLTLYTPQYDVATPENGNAVEAVLDVSGPVGLAPASRGVSAVVREVRRGGGTPLAFDRVVLAARG
ncbi:MAG TPA: hypothetical protein VLD63_08280, partial [Anaerolineales bacterium]|nr:hypothetical protein [Anaerolineales bacterium]